MKLRKAMWLGAVVLGLGGKSLGNPVPLNNPGFEKELSGWQAPPAEDTQAEAIPDAAHEGKAGLRITDNSTANCARVLSDSMEVTPGKRYRATFWARSSVASRAGVFLRFETFRHQAINAASLKFCNIPSTGGDWREEAVEQVAPENAAFLTILISSYSKLTGTLDLDDFALEELTDEAAKPPTLESPAQAAPPQASSAPAQTAPTNTTDGTGPVIILKLDDFRAVTGRRAVPAQWQKIADLLKERNLKASIGMICDTLADANQASLDWVKEQHDSGRVEFWFHGMDHLGWRDADGKAYAEFRKRSLEEQKKRFAMAQNLAREKLGFAFHTFGPPGYIPPAPQAGETAPPQTPPPPAFAGDNFGFDAATVEAMQDDPNMTIWLYPEPLDQAGRDLEAKGKVTILDRIWNANIEAPLFKPSLPALEKAYEQWAPTRKYLVLQGHPTHWDDERFAEFVRMVDYLSAKGARFMTPEEYVAWAKSDQH